MTQTQQELERLRTLQESYHDLDDKINVVLPALADKIDNIQLPEIDTSALAKQGENKDATNTAILEAVSNIVDTKNLYSVRFESNDDGPNTYTMVLPVVAGVVGDTIIL